MDRLEWEIGDLLRRYGLTLGAVESATGGLLSHLITSVPGSSDYFKGAVTAYSNEIKVKLVGVKPETLKKHGAVSSQVAEEMASGGCKVLAVDICLSDTGIAGPGSVTRRVSRWDFFSLVSLLKMASPAAGSTSVMTAPRTSSMPPGRPCPG